MVPSKIMTRAISIDVSAEEMIHIGMATRRFSQSLTSVCTKAQTTTGSRTAFQISIPEREVAFQRLLPSSRTRMKGKDLEMTRIEVLQHNQSQVAFTRARVASKDNDGSIPISSLSHCVMSSWDTCMKQNMYCIFKVTNTKRLSITLFQYWL